MSTKKKILIGLGIFTGLLLITAIAVYLSTSKERTLATQFVSAISNGQMSSAYSQYSDALKEVQDETTFETQIRTLQLDTSCKLEISSIGSATSTSSGASKTISGTVKCDTRTLNTAEFTYNSDGKLIQFEIKP